jgi:predicted transcriptional regulator
MTVTVKLDPVLEERLRQRAAGSGATTSDVIRAALQAYLAEDATPRALSPYALGKDLFGRYGDENRVPSDLATNRKRELAAIWAAKHDARGRTRRSPQRGR